MPPTPKAGNGTEAQPAKPKPKPGKWSEEPKWKCLKTYSAGPASYSAIAEACPRSQGASKWRYHTELEVKCEITRVLL